LECPPDHVVAKIRCLGEDCSIHVIECALVLGGSLAMDGVSHWSAWHETKWVPTTAGAEGSKLCGGGSLVTGINCGGTKCGQKKLLCQSFTPSSTCTPSCGLLDLQCGDDGCGGSCGSCANGWKCLSAVGQCMQEGLHSKWAAAEVTMESTGLVASGMGCKGHWCGWVRLLYMGVKVSESSVELSVKVSDNVGKKFAWNEKSDALAADCPEGKVITRVLCSGWHCDNLRLECAEILDWTLDTEGSPTLSPSKGWFSEENGGEAMCPESYAMTGLECQKSSAFKGWYCDNKKIRCRQIFPKKLGQSNRGMLLSGSPLPGGVDVKAESAGDNLLLDGVMSSRADDPHVFSFVFLVVAAATL